MPDNLALRMRPRSISEVIGQKHLVGEGKIIRRMVEANMLSSMILRTSRNRENLDSQCYCRNNKICF